MNTDYSQQQLDREVFLTELEAKMKSAISGSYCFYEHAEDVYHIRVLQPQQSSAVVLLRDLSTLEEVLSFW